MPRNTSFMLTTEQIRNRTKTVTRRLGWSFLKPGDILNACVKCQGLKKGEKIERICQIRVVKIGLLRVCDINHEDLVKEGFPDWTEGQFIDFFCEHNDMIPCDVVNRIEFEYMPEGWVLE